VVHPESVIHGLAEFADGSTMAQMATADMRLPIQLALAFPDRLGKGIKGLELAGLGRLTFEELDREAFPSLDLAYRAGRLGQTYPAALNAANEVAVMAFLGGKIRLIQIAEVVAAVLDEHDGAPVVSEVALARADRWARARAAEIIEDL
jgi:1-deoxy-D-xylulose-5-phosphate reductoisomerase